MTTTLPTPSGWARVAMGDGARTRHIGFGDSAAFRTAAECRRFAIQAQMYPEVVDVARQLAASVPDRDYDGYCAVIRNYLATHFRFVRDVRDADMLEPVHLQIARIQETGQTYGDCDDAATLASGLLLCVGCDVRLVLLAFNEPRAPFSHIYAEGEGSDGRWWDMDVTKPRGPVPPTGRSQIIPI